MTDEDISCLKGQIAFLKSVSTTKAPARRYSDEELKAAVGKVTGPLAFRPFWRP